jgi:hypothetical protein
MRLDSAGLHTCVIVRELDQAASPSASLRKGGIAAYRRRPRLTAGVEVTGRETLPLVEVGQEVWPSRSTTGRFGAARLATDELEKGGAA